MSVTDELKQRAAARALACIESGMTVGLGGGSTAALFIALLGEALKQGRLTDIVGIPSALSVGEFARDHGVPLTTFERHPRIHVCVDGADEVDAEMNLIKGGGGFLTREKIVAQASERLVIVVDESKLSDRLGRQWALPVEVMEFGLESHRRFLRRQGASKVELRLAPSGQPFRTDQGHLILDARFGPMSDPVRLARQLDARAGLVEHGLFLAMATDLIAAYRDGDVIQTRRLQP